MLKLYTLEYGRFAAEVEIVCPLPDIPPLPPTAPMLDDDIAPLLCVGIAPLTPFPLLIEEVNAAPLTSVPLPPIFEPVAEVGVPPPPPFPPLPADCPFPELPPLLEEAPCDTAGV